MSFFIYPRSHAASACGPCAPRTHNEFAPIFSLFEDLAAPPHRQWRPRRARFAPRFDLKEAQDAYTLEGELPGFDQKDISLEFSDEQTLVVTGRSESQREQGTRPEAITAPAEKTITDTDSASHQPTVEDADDTAQEAPADAAPAETEPAKTESAKPKDTYWVSERTAGRFSRTFAFSQRIDQEAVKASLKNGVLTVHIPKAAKPESRRITVE